VTHIEEALTSLDGGSVGFACACFSEWKDTPSQTSVKRLCVRCVNRNCCQTAVPAEVILSHLLQKAVMRRLSPLPENWPFDHRLMVFVVDIIAAKLINKVVRPSRTDSGLRVESSNTDLPGWAVWSGCNHRMFGSGGGRLWSLYQNNGQGLTRIVSVALGFRAAGWQRGSGFRIMPLPSSITILMAR